MKEPFVMSPWLLLFVIWVALLMAAATITVVTWGVKNLKRRPKVGSDESSWPKETVADQAVAAGKRRLDIIAKEYERENQNKAEPPAWSNNRFYDIHVADHIAATEKAARDDMRRGSAQVDAMFDGLEWKPEEVAAMKAGKTIIAGRILEDEPNVWAHGGGKPLESIHDLRSAAVEEQEKFEAEMDAVGDPPAGWRPDIEAAVNAEVAPDHEAKPRQLGDYNPDCGCNICNAARWRAPDGSIPKELEKDAPHVKPAQVKAAVDKFVEIAPIYWRQKGSWAVPTTIDERSGKDRRDHMHTIGESEFRVNHGLPTRRDTNKDRRAATIATPTVSQPENSETKLYRRHGEGISVNQRKQERRIDETFDWGPIERRSCSSDRRVATIAAYSTSQPVISETWPAVERRKGGPLPEHMRAMNERRVSGWLASSTRPVPF